ncbi:hypothetical protein quinque_016500, partial [Culex quinquefasciatus]
AIGPCDWNYRYWFCFVTWTAIGASSIATYADNIPPGHCPRPGHNPASNDLHHRRNARPGLARVIATGNGIVAWKRPATAAVAIVAGVCHRTMSVAAAVDC